MKYYNIKILFPLLVFVLYCHLAITQITPPGLGDTKMAGWIATGVRQALDTSGSKHSVIYFGAGRISTPSSFNPYNKPAIIILNKEFYNRFHKHWQYSLAVSYRRQNEYRKIPPYEEGNPSVKQEFRAYGRFSHLFSVSDLKVVTTARQEFRRFYTMDFSDWKESRQLRSRARVQLSYEVNGEKKHRLVSAAEALFVSSKRTDPTAEWSRLRYNECRLSFYYSHRPEGLGLTCNIGYMYNLVGQKSKAIDGHYIGFDVIWENLFWQPKPAL
ncbi:MAG: DUF2490 domain-containing protein [Crocinitomicaceae bacterium]|nr:DUF2490 domain-containing protein [Crocinitomicaceae bacterium]